MDQSHPDPVSEAAGAASGRAAKLASLMITLTQAWVLYQAHREQLQASRDAQAADQYAAAAGAARRQAQAAWAPALDPAWTATADLYQAARALGAAMPYAPRRPGRSHRHVLTACRHPGRRQGSAGGSLALQVSVYASVSSRASGTPRSATAWITSRARQ